MMGRWYRLLTLGSGLYLLVAPATRADLVVGYDAVDTSGSLTAINGVDVTGSALTRGSGISYAASTGGADYNSSNWTNAAAPDVTDSWNFSFTSTTPYDLSSLQVRAQSTSVGPMTLRLEIDPGSGFAQQGTDQSVSTTAMDVVFNFTLLNVTSATVRLLGFNSSNSGVNSQLAILDDGNYDLGGTADLVLNGTVVVPEPGAVLFGGLVCGVIGLAAAGRRVIGMLHGPSAV
jgi:hypothetical protein